jgi:hypothetical protein
VLALSFVTDDFFASIRSAYNLRADDPEYCRLTFCLLGVAAPADLIQNSVRTPFNIGKEIRLDDFSRAELGALLPGLDGLGCDPVVLLDAVYAWTSGHPYMTQRLCDDLDRHGPIEPGHEAPASTTPPTTCSSAAAAAATPTSPTPRSASTPTSRASACARCSTSTAASSTASASPPSPTARSRPSCA